MSIKNFILRATKTTKKKLEIKEVDIEHAYCKYAKNRHCLALKLIFLNKRGFPDRTTLCPRGKILFIEFKRKGKIPTANQIKLRAILERFGFEYHICDQIGQAESTLDTFLR